MVAAALFEPETHEYMVASAVPLAPEDLNVALERLCSPLRIQLFKATRGSMADPKDKPAIHSEEPGSKRDPEERPAETGKQVREKSHDKTLADSFPTSDPPSSIPDPSGDSVGSNPSDEEAA